MPSKFCDVCNKTVTTSYIPHFCCWCGKDLSNEPLIEDITKFYAANPVKKAAPKPVEVAPGRLQMKLF